MDSARCPRCATDVHPPGVWTSAWRCPQHGEVHPLQPSRGPKQELLDDLSTRSPVPVWVPWPIPAGWLFSGVAEAGSPKTGPQAVVVACSGPNPAPHPDAPGERTAELLLVAEAPGVGLGAYLAGLDDVDPGNSVGQGTPHARIRTNGHTTALWHLDSAADRAVYVGEAGGVWLYLVLWPATAGVLLAESLHLTDVRQGTSGRAAVQPPAGAPSPKLP